MDLPKPKPGDYKPELWHEYYGVGLFRSIPDYSRYLGSEGDMLGWLSPAEDVELGKYWESMARMARNIEHTVDDRWDDDPADCDWIPDEKYIGPIGWPANWREDLLGAQGQALNANQGLRVSAGAAVPQAGLWQAEAQSARQQRARSGDQLPDLGSTYGTTVWQRVGD